MKKFITKCFCFLCLLLLVFAAGLAMPPAWVADSLDYSILDKHAKLRERNGRPRLLLVGGSNLTFGVVSPMIENKFDVEVVNTAVNAGYGLKYIIDDIKPFVREGDTVLLVPEYAHFFNRTFYGGEPLLGALNVAPSSVKLLDHNQLLATARDAPKYSLDKFRMLLKARIRGVDARPYTRSSFNSHGDVVAHWELKPKPFANTKLLSGEYEPQAMQYVLDFAAFVESRGGRFSLSYPCLNQGSYSQSGDAVAKVQQEFRASGLHLVGTPARYSFPDQLYFDTHYHLVKEGQIRRTEYLIEDLSRDAYGIAARTGPRRR